MRHIIAFFFKLIIVFIILYPILDILFGFSISNVSFVSFLLAAFAGIFGELSFFTFKHNKITKIIGLGLIMFFFLMVIKLVFNISTNLILGIVSSGILIALSERFLHKYFINKIIID